MAISIINNSIHSSFLRFTHQTNEKLINGYDLLEREGGSSYMNWRRAKKIGRFLCKCVEINFINR